MLSELLAQQIESLRSVSGGVISNVDGFVQTVEDPDTLNLDHENARVHSKENLDAIGTSLNEFGFRKASVSVKEGTRRVYAGNGVVTWLLMNEIDVCPVIWIPESFTDEQAMAFALADNRSGELSDWNFSQLEENLKAVGADFDANDLGFDENFLEEIFSNFDEIDDVFKESEDDEEEDEERNGLVKLLLEPDDLLVVERALAEAEMESRGKALSKICRRYLDEKRKETEEGQPDL